MLPCPNCGIAGNSFGCTNHIITYGTPADPGLIVPDTVTHLFAEIGRLHVKLKESEDRARGLESLISALKEQKVIDQFGRPLPLREHIPGCPHGRNGWAYCTCDLQSETQELEAAMGFGMEKPVSD
jgi:hypothetical protein